MILVSVNSSQIKAIGYDSSTRELAIEFKVKFGRSVYRYANVPPLVADEIFYAKSIGNTFGQAIKKQPDKYPFERVSPAELDQYVVGEYGAWQAAMETPKEPA